MAISFGYLLYIYSYFLSRERSIAVARQAARVPSND